MTTATPDAMKLPKNTLDATWWDNLTDEGIEQAHAAARLIVHRSGLGQESLSTLPIPPPRIAPVYARTGDLRINSLPPAKFRTRHSDTRGLAQGAMCIAAGTALRPSKIRARRGTTAGVERLAPVAATGLHRQAAAGHEACADRQRQLA